MRGDVNVVDIWLPTEFDRLMRDMGPPGEEITDDARIAFLSGMIVAVMDVMGYKDVAQRMTELSRARSDGLEGRIT